MRSLKKVIKVRFEQAVLAFVQRDPTPQINIRKNEGMSSMFLWLDKTLIFAAESPSNALSKNMINFENGLVVSAISSIWKMLFWHLGRMEFTQPGEVAEHLFQYPIISNDQS